MKTAHKPFILPLILIQLFIFTQVLTVRAQAPAPPDPPGSHGTGVNTSPMGGGPLGAPIDGGASIFLLFAAGYGSREWLKRKK